ncbi:hypothetical protein BG006_008086 [Podila minutissima]|uniref:C3H1-type domain-containing protein n=1 Tax=Podila minutissima TaxID=64525 RepID=A0A9P5VJV3_9FUNG|nr:hypothetical protein BG006_008086 [Podila minutissima]
MAIIQLGTPQETELSALILAKLIDFGWPDNDTLANFIVVMVANEKTKEEITSELNDTSEFSEWLFDHLTAVTTSSEAQQAQVLPQQPSPQIQRAEDLEEAMDTSSSRKFTSEARPPGRLLKNAISSATRSDPAPSRQAPSRVYGERRQEARDRSISPIRSRELTKGRDTDDRIRFRRTSEERSRDEARIAARLGPMNDHNTGRRGRQGRDDRLENRARDKSWDDRSDYHDRRNRGNPVKTREQALRDIERRLGPRADSRDRSNRRSSYGSNHREPSYEQEEIDDVKPARCKFWPNCTQGDLCQFWHPKELCPLLPNCPSTADSCYYVHPLAEPTAEQLAAAARQALLQSMRPTNGTGNALQNSGALGSSTECKFGARCTRPDCMFRHSERESKQPCRFFPNCTKPNCPFYHPPYGESLSNGTVDANDNVTRLSTPCKFADLCTRAGCHFTHPRDGDASNVPLCKFNPCTRQGCTYRHVPGGTFVGNKTLVLNNTRPHTSDRFAGATANEEDVEKLHVPASTHWANGGVSHQPDADVDMDVAM